MATDCQLNLLISKNDVALSLFDNYQSKFIGFQKFEFKSIEELGAIFNQGVFLGEFKQVQVMVGSQPSTLVPTVLFDEDNQADYIDFMTSKSSDSKVLTDHLNSIDSKNIYNLPSELVQKLNDYFPNAKLIHASTNFIESIISKHKNEEGIMSFVNINSSTFDLIVSEGKKLHYNNSFDYTSDEELLYYLLFVFEQLKLNPESCSLTIFGNLNSKSDLFGLIRKYIRNVDWGTRNDSVNYSYALNSLNDHEQYLLLNNFQCE